MASQVKYEWLAVYLYYNEPWETFLTEAVEPYVKTVLQTQIAHQFFFVRFWERGPHIRLRLLADASIINPILRPNLEEHFHNYMETWPSRRIDPNYPATFPEEYKWTPNNSLRFVDYETEIKRYGGAQGLKIAEKQFFLSSRIVLQNLKKNKDSWVYDDAMGTAIKLHVSFAWAMGMDAATAKSFFEFIFYNWLPRSFRLQRKNYDPREYREQSKETLSAFENSFKQQKESLLSFIGAVWTAMDRGEEFEEEIMMEWINGNKNLALQMSANFESGSYELRKKDYQFSGESYSKLSPEQEQKWMFLADFIHMTNNRLGILNRDEGFLAYLIKEVLNELSNMENTSKSASLQN